jgi:hypothetical protein
LEENYFALTTLSFLKDYTDNSYIKEVEVEGAIIKRGQENDRAIRKDRKNWN